MCESVKIENQEQTKQEEGFDTKKPAEIWSKAQVCAYNRNLYYWPVYMYIDLEEFDLVKRDFFSLDPLEKRAKLVFVRLTLQLPSTVTA